MKIKNLLGSGIKGSNAFVQPLAPVTVFTGVNGAGKTTRLDALTLALADGVPGVAAKPNDVFDRFASDDTLAVGFETDSGQTVSRVWTRVKGSVKHTSSVSGFPDDWTLSPVALDASAFLGLSPKERTKFLFRTLPPPSLEKVGPSVLVANVKNIRLAENTPESEAAIGDLVKWIEKEAADNLDLSTNLLKLTIQEWLDQLVEKLRVKKNEATASAKRMEQTVAGLTQLKADGENLPAAEAAKAQAQQVLDDAKSKLTTARANYQTANAALLTAQSLAAKAVDETATLAEVGTYEASLAETEGKLSEPFNSNLVKSLRAKETELGNALMNPIGAMLADAIARLQNEIMEITECGACPYCKAQTVGWKDALLAEKNSVLQLKLQEQTGLTTTRATIQAELETVQSALATAEKDAATRRDNETLLVSIKTHLLSLRNRLVDQAEAMAAKAKLPQLQADVQKLVEQGKALSAAVDAAQQTYDAADARLRKAIADRSAAASQAKALSEAAKVRCEVEILKQFSDFLNSLMEKVVEQSVGPMLATCNRLCEGILPAPLLFVDGELGMKCDRAADGFVTWRTFSGAERQLTFAAISVALAVGQPFKLVMIDEFGKLSHDNKKLMLLRLLELAKSGVIDQAIIVDPDGSFYQNIHAGDVGFVCVSVTR
jgi:hypothetical protein